jgi:hypothetical protein
MIASVSRSVRWRVSGGVPRITAATKARGLPHHRFDRRGAGVEAGVAGATERIPTSPDGAEHSETSCDPRSRRRPPLRLIRGRLLGSGRGARRGRPAVLEHDSRTSPAKGSIRQRAPAREGFERLVPTDRTRERRRWTSGWWAKRGRGCR